MGLGLVSSLVPELDDHAAGTLVLARLVALGQYTPGADRVLPRRSPAFAAAVGVVDGVHRHAAHRGPDTAPANAARLSDRFQAVLLVAHLADGRAAVEVDLADLARAQAHLRVSALPCEELHRSPRRARELRAAAGLHLHAVDGSSDGDVAQRQRVSRLDRGVDPGNEQRSGGQALGRDDVAALAAGVAQQARV